MAGPADDGRNPGTGFVNAVFVPPQGPRRAVPVQQFPGLVLVSVLQDGTVVAVIVLLAEVSEQADLIQFVENIERAFFLAEDAVGEGRAVGEAAEGGELAEAALEDEVLAGGEGAGGEAVVFLAEGEDLIEVARGEALAAAGVDDAPADAELRGDVLG